MDLNSDLGEGFGAWQLGDDDALLTVVTSANVACGFHAGDPVTMRRVCVLAASRSVAIGAQVAYRDLAGFGRRRIEYAPDELRDDILYQLGALEAFARTAGTRVGYVKPHGALYHVCTADAGQARALVDAVCGYDPELPVLCQPGSMLAKIAIEMGLEVVAEGFADRGYLPDGRLVPRQEPGALVTDPAEVVDRAVRMAVEGTVLAVDGSAVECTVASLCIHSDTPGAVELARQVRSGLAEAGVPIEPFASLSVPPR